ncbi:MAG: endolytic transglycosylase MltG [Bacteroidota bacterium]|nr:endolytic transglycosylase MltG [Bacteroidota bacterium]
MFLITGLLILILIIISIGASQLWINNIKDKKSTTEFYIDKMVSLEQIAHQLDTLQIIKSKVSFLTSCKLLRFTDQRVKLGRYVFKNGMNNFQIVSKLKSGIQDPVKVTLNNVRNIQELVGKLDVYLQLDSSAMIQKLTDSLYVDSLGYNVSNILTLFIPNTYEMYWTISFDKLIQRFKLEHYNFWKKGNRLELAKIKNLDEKQAYIVASIVEKETIVEAEKSTIAGVYLNRIRTGMKLQADPTVVFAMGLLGIQRILYEHLTTISPFNTYMVEGLPPGPICMPSLSSLDAVLNAEEHEYIFFCAKPGYDGSHAFAKTYFGHAQNAKIYRSWLDKERIR